MTSPRSLKAIYSVLACLLVLYSAKSAPADSTEIRGKMMDDSSSAVRAAPPNSEKSGTVPAAFSKSNPSGTEETAPSDEGRLDGPCQSTAPAEEDVPFRITVDGEPMVEDGKRREADRQRCVDVALERADIQIHYDPLQISPALNVWTVPNGVLRGKAVHFYTYTNYALWLRKAEIRIFKEPDTRQEPYAVIPLDINGEAFWNPPVHAPDDLFFLLRVYDGRNRFDETMAKHLTVLSVSKTPKDTESEEREELVGFGENSRKTANIPIYGGTVSINGEGVLKGETVSALGFPVPVDRDGKFALRQIMPAGPRTIEIAIRGADGSEKVFRRNISIADHDWFYIAMADLTIGRNSVSGPVELVTGDAHHYNDSEYVDGRGAFYLKGLIKGAYLLTASMDTRERPIGDLFSNFDSKDPQYLLRRIDPDKYYPVYGDDSTVADDAPTQGKFYVRLEKGDSSIMWGNFLTSWTGAELSQYNRGLYGANFVLSPHSTTQYGEKRLSVNAFAAEPGTMSSRDEFRGTGGSLYYLRHLDITQGSDRLWIEIRDKDSEIVIERRQLTPAEDYDVNYIQGRVMLRAPLPSTADGSTLVRTSLMDGNPVYLVATYEYVPGFHQLDSIALGGKAGFWINDNFRIGATAYKQGEDQEKQQLEGFDLTARYKPGTFLKAEMARSDGPGNGTLLSSTGGFGFNYLTASGEKAGAWRIDGAVDFSELHPGSTGKISMYWKEREQGFSAPGEISNSGEAVSQMGFFAQAPFGVAQVYSKADHQDSDSLRKTSAEAGVTVNLNREFALSMGARWDARDVNTPNSSAILSQNGSRTDAIARVDFRPLIKQPNEAEAPYSNAAPAAYKPWSLFGFLQGTLARTEDRTRYDRAGMGASWQMTDRFKLGLEASGGQGGLGGEVSGDYRIDDRSSVYLSYVMESEIADAETRGTKGTGVFGSRYKVHDNLSIFGETRLTNGYASGLVHSFGLDLAPSDRWTHGLKFETGTLANEITGDMRRTAVALATTYKYENVKFANALEYRKDRASAEDRSTWLVRNSFGYLVNPSWRILSKLNFSISDSTADSYYNADFIEGVLGAAFRPVRNDKLNALFKYTYFHNLPSQAQLTAANSTPDYLQKSQVLDADVIYDLLPWISVGGKYGLRVGELKPSRTDGQWFSSTAQLWIARTDVHIVHKWDVLIEGRRLSSTEARDARFGMLVAVYRRLNKGVKLGVGYNFTDFSDNLTNLSYKSRGVFMNIVGAF